MTEQPARHEIPANLDITALPDANIERGIRNQLDEPENFFYWGHGQRPDLNMAVPLIARIDRNGITGQLEVIKWDGGEVVDHFGLPRSGSPAGLRVSASGRSSTQRSARLRANSRLQPPPWCKCWTRSPRLSRSPGPVGRACR